jgi:hypothetical protein
MAIEQIAQLRGGYIYRAAASQVVNSLQKLPFSDQ